MFTVYHIRLKDSDPVYVGQTKKPLNVRLNEHWKNKSSYLNEWLQKQNRDDVIIEAVIRGAEENVDEIRMIYEYANVRGYKLLNRTKGGTSNRDPYTDIETYKKPTSDFKRKKTKKDNPRTYAEHLIEKAFDKTTRRNHMKKRDSKKVVKIKDPLALLEEMKNRGLTKEDCIKHCKGKNRTVTDKELAMIETVFR